MMTMIDQLGAHAYIVVDGLFILGSAWQRQLWWVVAHLGLLTLQVLVFR